MHADRSSLQFIAFSSLVLARYVLRASQIAVAKAVYGSIWSNCILSELSSKILLAITWMLKLRETC